MNKADTRVRSSKSNFVIALTLLLLTNVLTCVTLMTMSKITLREQIDQRMLDIANTAAYQLNGDELKDLQAADEGTEAYTNALETLRSFQDNIQLDYIYGIRQMEDGSFTFTIDPAVNDPGEFGAPVVSTAALRSAASGTPAVDKKAYSDDWGRFYSAYSPVFASDGSVAGIVGVDFNAQWYEGKLGSHWAVAAVLIMAALTVGIALSFTIMSQNRKRFSSMLRNLAAINQEAQRLDNAIMQTSIKKLDLLPASESAVLKTLALGNQKPMHVHDEYEELNSSIGDIYQKLHKYIAYLDSEVYNDAATGVQNKAAYKKKIQQLDDAIAVGKGDCAVGFFDINGIKRLYIHKGFEAGEMLMFECAKILKTVFGKENVYHVAGDEFIVLLEGVSRTKLNDFFIAFDKELENYNTGKDADHTLSVAKGAAVYHPDDHASYRQVFIAAKQKCDEDKAAHYKKLGQT